jgi:hypothetical protein
MVQRLLAGVFAFCLLSGILLAQGMDTRATKDDWEEINFEFNSSILSDGYPSLLKLADLLKQHPDFRVKLEGHTDSVGSHRYNEKLAMARATTVKNFLVKYGAAESQITTTGLGKRNPEVPNRSKEGRFINRRVVLTVTDGQGRVIATGGISDIGPTLADLLKKQEECCSQILKKLDKLDDILAALRDLKNENDRLKSDVASLKDEQGRMKQQMESAPKPLTAGETKEIATSAAAGAVDEAQSRNKKFSLLGLNVGPTTDGTLTFTGKGRFFSPFGGSGTHAVQAEAEYMYYRNRQEGQFDLGLVNRWNRVQAGMFSSFKYVGMRDYGGGGTLAQGAFTFDYLFSRGRIGLFGTKGFKNEAVLSRQPIGPTSFNEYYLRVVDQIGGSAQVGLWKDAYAEGNLGYLKRYGRTFAGQSLSSRPGGLIRLVQPVNERVALTLEAGLNETLLGVNDSGRVVFGVQFGNWLRPKEYLNIKSPVPVDIPRIRYELLSRRVGNSAPVADAGPDQIGVQPGTITLNGAGSYDPDGDTLQYKWEQIAGPSVSISGMNSATATFTAAENQTYSFRLTVTDPGGMKSTARTTVTTAKPPEVRITRFTAQPDRIRAGESSLLTWNVDNADEVTITGIGKVANSGTQSVTPSETTTYRITAKGKGGEASDLVTVYVETPDVRILRFQAAPASIVSGETSTLSWATDNAATVSILGVSDNLPANGSVTVAPTTSTTYTLVARSKDGREVSAATSVVVTVGLAPRVLNFSASPISIAPGGSTQLCWQVDNVTEVAISGLGTGLKPADCATVSPDKTTTYSLTAKNNQGSVTVSTTVSVVLPVRILTFSSSPEFSTKAGDPVTLSWTTENATSVQITGTGAPTGSLPANGSVVVYPNTNTNYTLTAYGPAGSVSAVLHVFVR